MSFFKETRQKKLFEDVKKYYKTHFNKNSFANYIHRLDHIARVIWWAKFISLREKADLSITIPAAILHDIGRSKSGNELHAKEGNKLCRSLLKKCGYDKIEIKRIANAISTHSTHQKKLPEIVEAMIIFDADKLDTLGPIGLHRWFFEYARMGYRNDETAKKILEHLNKWKHRYGNQIFFTKTAKKISVKGLLYIEKTCKEILKDSNKFKKIYKETGLSD
jgi:uncharacterized protein